VTLCIEVAAIGPYLAVQGMPESWESVTAGAVRVARLGAAGDLNGPSLYVVQPGARHYLVEE
jgi:hypothetical protein